MALAGLKDKILELRQVDPAYREVMRKYDAVRSESADRIGRFQREKDHFLVLNHWAQPPTKEDEIHALIPYTSSIDLKYADFIAQAYPGFQVMAPGPKPAAKNLAGGVEKLIYKVLYDNYHNQLYNDFAMNLSTLGTGLHRVFWDSKDKTGGKTGSIKIEVPSNFRVLIAFGDSNWRKIDYWCTEEWMSVESFEAKYGVTHETSVFDTLLGGTMDTTDPINQTADLTELGNTPTNVTNIRKVHVIKYHDDNKDLIVGNGKVLAKDEHNLGHHGLFISRNIVVPNEPFGFSNHYLVKDLQSRLEAIDSRILEILNQTALPILFDKGNVLKGVRIDHRVGKLYTTAAWKEGEGVDALRTDPNLQPLMAQRENVLNAIHDITGMPKAAFGSYQPGTHSGFAMNVQMQPTLMRTEVLQDTEIAPALQGMAKHFIKLTRKYGDSEIKKLLPEEAERLTIKVKFANPLPKDDAREVQNQTALVSNKLISRYTARENLLIEDPLDEAEKIVQEAQSFAENPDQALQLAGFQQSQQAVEDQKQAMAQGGQPGQPLQPGQAPEQRFPTPAGQEVESSQTAEAEQGPINSIAPTSTV